MDLEELKKIIYKIGFFRVKAKNLKALSKKLIDEFNGVVPQTLEELTSLPGVGRKTANCLLAYKFNIPAIAVDVHVHVIANRLGWINTTTPEKSEFALRKLVPRELWIDVNRLFVGHGQQVCSSPKPKCKICPITNYCRYFKKHF